MPESFFSRLGSGLRAFGREVFGFPLPDHLSHDAYGIPALFKPKESLDAFNNNVWLYAAVGKIAQEIARTKFRLRNKRKDGSFDYIEKHQALETLSHPQPLPSGKSSLTGFNLKYVLGMHLGLNGEGVWVVRDRLKAGGAPQRIDPLIPEFVFVKTDPNTGDLSEYVYRLPDRWISIDPADVVHFKLPDAQNWNRGHAPTQGIRYALDTYREAERMNLKRLQNNAVPGGIIKSGDTKLDDDQIRRLRMAWQQLYGGTENAGRTAILTKGLDWQPTQLSNTEMQFMEGKDRNRDEILANFGIGLEILGRTEAQTRANAEAAIFVFMRFGVLFFLENIVDTLNNDYLPCFPGTDNLEFAFDDPVPDNVDEKRQTIATLIGSGALTPDEARKMLGMEPLNIVGVTDVPYTNFNLVPAGQAPPAKAPLA